MGEIISQVIMIIPNIIEPLVLDLFWRTISKQKPNRTVFRIVGIVLFLIYLGLNPFLLDWVGNNGIACYIINNIPILFSFLYAALFYVIPKKVIFIYLSARYLIGILIEYIVTFLIVLIFQFNVEELLEPTLVKAGAYILLELLDFLILYLLTRFHLKHGGEINNKRIFYLLLIAYVIEVILFGVFFCFSISEQNMKFDIIVIMILLYEVVLLRIGSWVFEMKKKEYSDVIEFTNKQIEMLSDTQDKISDSQKILHDITNHLCTICSMAESNMCSEITMYIEKLLPEVKKCRITDVGNSLLSVILYERRAKAKRFDVTLEANIGVEDIKLPIFELNAIISNMIDNAIEACTKISNRKDRIVEFRVYVKGENLIMECRNPYVEEPIIDEDGTFITSKEDKKNHGKGIQIIFEYVERFNGDVDIHYNNREFIMKIILSNEVVVQ